jgi:c-di-GMP-binding flagellar brake protein YcgR
MGEGRSRVPRISTSQVAAQGLVILLDIVCMSGATTSQRPKLSLAIGTLLSVSGRSGIRMSARVLGRCEGASIIAHIPSVTSLDLMEGDEVAVRFLAGRTAYGFKTTVLRVCAMPYPYFHLAYPVSIQDVEVRESERVALTIPALVKNSAGTQTEVQIRDLSRSGALLFSPSSLGSPGDALQLSFELNLGHIKRSLQLGVTVRSAQTSEPQAPQTIHHRFGVQFHALPEADQIFLLAVIYERLAIANGIAAAVPVGNQTE